MSARPPALLRSMLERSLPADVRAGLERRGHALREISDTIGNVNAIGLDSDGHWLGAADPRRQGHAVAPSR